MPARHPAPEKSGCRDGRSRLRWAGYLGYEVTDENRRHTESISCSRRFPAEVPRGWRSGGGGVYDLDRACAGPVILAMRSQMKIGDTPNPSDAQGVSRRKFLAAGGAAAAAFTI